MRHCRICQVMWEEVFSSSECWVDPSHDGAQGFLPVQNVPRDPWIPSNLAHAREVHRLTAEGWT